MWNSFALAVRFVTSLPPLSEELATRAQARQSVAVLPLAGALIGLVLAAVWTLSLGVWRGQPLIAAALTLAAQALLTGGRGLGGVARAADGMAALGERRDVPLALATMRDPRRGTAGLVALGVCLLVKFAFLAALPAPLAWPGLALAATLGRWATSFGLSAFPLASVGQDAEAGPGLSDAGPSEFLSATVLTILCAVVLPKRGLLILVAVALIAGPVAQTLNRRLGGVTLPLCLALGELGEIAALACLALNV